MAWQRAIRRRRGCEAEQKRSKWVPRLRRAKVHGNAVSVNGHKWHPGTQQQSCVLGVQWMNSLNVHFQGDAVAEKLMELSDALMEGAELAFLPVR